MLTRQSGCIPADYYAVCPKQLIKTSFFAPVLLSRHREINRSRVQKRVMAGDLKQILFVESGFGCDQHGQNATAVVRACRNAIEFNSIPSVERLVPGGRNGLKLKIKIGTPFPDTVDLQEVKKVFPYGQTFFELVDGGLCCNSGVAIPELGDKNDDMLIAVAAVTVGF
ncbi:TPA: hypothetical protein ACH3X2_011756 [Trebouxia sp. C0005]